MEYDMLSNFKNEECWKVPGSENDDFGNRFLKSMWNLT